MCAEEVAALCGFAGVEPLYVNRHRKLLPGALAARWRGRLWWRQADIRAYLKEELDDSFDRRWAERHEKKAEPIKTFARELADQKAAGHE